MGAGPKGEQYVWAVAGSVPISTEILEIYILPLEPEVFS